MASNNYYKGGVNEMPLLKGKKNIGRNIKELEKANNQKSNSKKRSHEEIIAIALSKVNKKRK
jgi:hypothetical protein